MERKSIGNMGEIPSDLVDAFCEEAGQRQINKNVLMKEILEERYGKITQEGRLPLFPSEEYELKEIIEKYESARDEPWKIMELKRLQHKVRKGWGGNRVFYQHRQQDEKNLPDFVKNIIDGDPTEKILYETLILTQEIFKGIKNDLKERELWVKDIFPCLQSILENKKTKADILEEAIKGLCAMTDENGNLMIIESKTRKKAIDILSYMVDLQKRCYSRPECKTFLEFDARLWKVLYIDTISKKDLRRLKEKIYANRKNISDQLNKIYIKMLEGINYRLEYELKN